MLTGHSAKNDTVNAIHRKCTSLYQQPCGPCKARGGCPRFHHAVVSRKTVVDIDHPAETCRQKSLPVMHASGEQNRGDMCRPCMPEHYTGQLSHQRLGVSTPLARYNKVGSGDGIVGT